MNRCDHHEGFEAEAALTNMFKDQSEVAQWKDFKELHSAIFANAFQKKPCRRVLQYICQDSFSSTGGYFVNGDVYVSIDFLIRYSIYLLF